MVEQLPKKKGFASYFPTICSKCNYSRNLYSSKTFSPSLSNKKVGMKSFEANLRMVYAMRSNGIAFSGLEKFCSVMNLPKPMTRCNYDKLSNLLRDAVKSVAETSMKNAAQTTRANINVNDDDIKVDTGVSVDGSWQRRGFSSSNGVVTVISNENGKILDTETICKLCKACNAKEKLRSNVGNVKNMQDAILASMFHVASSDSNNYHDYCPKTPDSWCQYQLDAINKTNQYTPGAGISEDVILL